MNDIINKIHSSNNIDLLQRLENNSIDSIITDIPYGLQNIDALKLIKENINNTRGFMGKEWDILPSIEMLKEFYRVLKTGSYFITTFTPRQDLQCVFYYRLLEAGFDISFSPIYWAYASGFPKASNYSKNIQKHQNIEMEVIGKRNNYLDGSIRKYQKSTGDFIGTSIKEGGLQDVLKFTTPQAIYCEGIYSNSPKPAVEVIIIAQKPHNQAKYQQALTWYNERKELLDKGIKEEDLCFYTKNSSGGVNFDETRIPISQDDIDTIKAKANKININDDKVFIKNNNIVDRFDNCINNASQGRFPANILVSDNSLDVFRDFKSGAGDKRANNKNRNGFLGSATDKQREVLPLKNYQTDSGDLSRYFSLDSWTKKHHPELYKLSKKTLALQEDAEKISPFLFTSKPSEAEKNTLKQNTHVCCKPIALFNYLITMFTHENDIVVDPFCGSGTTCIASVLTNRKYIGIDIGKEYCDIAEARIEYWKESSKKQEKDDSLFDQ